MKKLVASWQKIEENGGSPTSAVKLLKAKKAEPVEEIIEEEIIEEAAMRKSR